MHDILPMPIPLPITSEGKVRPNKLLALPLKPDGLGPASPVLCAPRDGAGGQASTMPSTGPKDGTSYQNGCLPAATGATAAVRRPSQHLPPRALCRRETLRDRPQRGTSAPIRA